MKGRLILLVVLVLTGGVRAGENLAGTEKLANEVIAAVRNGDDEALRRHAARPDEDPWYVADMLLLRGEAAAAETFAAVAPQPATGPLPEYVRWRKGREDDPETRRVLTFVGSPEGAADPGKAIAEFVELKPTEDLFLSARIRFAIALAYWHSGKHAEGAAAFFRAGEEAEEVGWLAGAVTCYGQSGVANLLLNRPKEGVAPFEKSIEISVRRGNEHDQGVGLTQLGLVQHRLEDYESALASQARARSIFRTRNNPRQEGLIVERIATVHQVRAEYTEALAAYREALDLFERASYERGAARMLLGLGGAYKELGDTDRALALVRSAAESMERRGDTPYLCGARATLGNLHKARGEYAAAIRELKRSLELARAMEPPQPAMVAASLQDLAGVWVSLGDFPKAESLLTEARDDFEAVGSSTEIARSRFALGRLYESVARYEDALGTYRLAAEILEEEDDPAAAAALLSRMGSVKWRLGKPDEALELSEEALRRFRAIGKRSSAAGQNSMIGRILLSRGEVDSALACCQEALAGAEDCRDEPTRLRALWGLAACRLARREHELASARAHEAAESLRRLGGGLSDQGGAKARAPWADLYAVGLVAALHRKDVEDAAYFLESSRAQALIESLRSRENLRGAILPDALQEEANAVRSRVSHATWTFLRAVKAKDEEATAAAVAELDEARTAAMEVDARIQREAKANANLLRPAPAPLAEIRDSLGNGDVLVVYALFHDDLVPYSEAVALVVRRGGAKVVRLGATAEIEELCARLRLVDPAFEWAEAAKDLTERVVEPLGLGPEDRRLLVSPDGPLAYVPFHVLRPDGVVAYVPSGTTWRWFAGEERGEKGVGVLALGDPAYGTTPDPESMLVRRSGDWLQPIPASGDEAREVGDVVLTGKDATEAGFRAALKKRPRWRAVHLACHGLLDPDRPALSSLALTPGGEDDGFLSVLEVFRTPIPADLAVLSACETGRGEIVRGEGVLGLTRAFLFAGPPRVIVSLWRVEDEATMALMTKFYELWRAGDVPCAEALRRAQEHVRDRPDGKWAHPYYWAAWQLWGLPD